MTGRKSAVLKSPVLLVFSATAGLGAALLFVLEPTVGKWVLPYLGGAPAVWNTCLMFFQAALLAGYAWVHIGTRAESGAGDRPSRRTAERACAHQARHSGIDARAVFIRLDGRDEQRGRGRGARQIRVAGGPT